MLLILITILLNLASISSSIRKDQIFDIRYEDSSTTYQDGIIKVCPDSRAMKVTYYCYTYPLVQFEGWKSLQNESIPSKCHRLRE